jgi:hypothetical protein
LAPGLVRDEPSGQRELTALRADLDDLGLESISNLVRVGRRRPMQGTRSNQPLNRAD